MSKKKQANNRIFKKNCTKIDCCLITEKKNVGFDFETKTEKEKEFK